MRRSLPSSNPLRENLVLLKKVESDLAQSGIVSAAAEAESLVRFFARSNRVDFFTGRKNLSPAQKKALFRAVQKRRRRIPLQHILGETEFCGHRIFVTPDALVPRPETEKLCETALEILSKEAFSKAKPVRILDLGTGSGCIAISLTLALPNSKMTALDISAKALKIARKNIKFHGLGKKVTLAQSDLFSAFSGKKMFFDMIVSNPPYIPERDLRSLPAEVRHDPQKALLAGHDGLGVIRKIIDAVPGHLNPGGWLIFEFGEGQKNSIRKLIVEKKFFQEYRFIRDDARKDRIFAGKIG